MLSSGSNIDPGAGDGTDGEMRPTGRGTINMGPTDGETINMGPTDEGTVNIEPTDGGTVNIGPTDGGTVNIGPTDGGTVNIGPTNGGTVNIGPTDGGTVNIGPTDGGTGPTDDGTSLKREGDGVVCIGGCGNPSCNPKCQSGDNKIKWWFAKLASPDPVETDHLSEESVWPVQDYETDEVGDISDEDIHWREKHGIEEYVEPVKHKYPFSFYDLKSVAATAEVLTIPEDYFASPSDSEMSNTEFANDIEWRCLRCRRPGLALPRFCKKCSFFREKKLAAARTRKAVITRIKAKQRRLEERRLRRQKKIHKFANRFWHSARGITEINSRKERIRRTMVSPTYSDASTVNIGNISSNNIPSTETSLPVPNASLLDVPLNILPELIIPTAIETSANIPEVGTSSSPVQFSSNIPLMETSVPLTVPTAIETSANIPEVGTSSSLVQFSSNIPLLETSVPMNIPSNIEASSNIPEIGTSSSPVQFSSNTPLIEVPMDIPPDIETSPNIPEVGMSSSPVQFSSNIPLMETSVPRNIPPDIATSSNIPEVGTSSSPVQFSSYIPVMEVSMDIPPDIETSANIPEVGTSSSLVQFSSNIPVMEVPMDIPPDIETSPNIPEIGMSLPEYVPSDPEFAANIPSLYIPSEVPSTIYRPPQFFVGKRPSCVIKLNFNKVDTNVLEGNFNFFEPPYWKRIMTVGTVERPIATTKATSDLYFTSYPLESESDPPIAPPGRENGPQIIQPGNENDPQIIEPGAENDPQIIQPGAENDHPIVPPGNENDPPIIPPRNENDHPIILAGNENDHPIAPLGCENGPQIVPPGNENDPQIIQPGAENDHPIVPPGNENDPPIILPRNENDHPIILAGNENDHPIAPPGCENGPQIVPPGAEYDPLIIHPGAENGPLIPPGNENDPPIIPLVNENDPLIVQPGNETIPLIVPRGNENERPIVASGAEIDPQIIQPGRENDPPIVQRQSENDGRILPPGNENGPQVMPPGNENGPPIVPPVVEPIVTEEDEHLLAVTNTLIKEHENNPDLLSQLLSDALELVLSKEDALNYALEQADVTPTEVYVSDLARMVCHSFDPINKIDKSIYSQPIDLYNTVYDWYSSKHNVSCYPIVQCCHFDVQSGTPSETIHSDEPVEVDVEMAYKKVPVSKTKKCYSKRVSKGKSQPKAGTCQGPGSVVPQENFVFKIPEPPNTSGSIYRLRRQVSSVSHGKETAQILPKGSEKDVCQFKIPEPPKTRVFRRRRQVSSSTYISSDSQSGGESRTVQKLSVGSAVTQERRNREFKTPSTNIFSSQGKLTYAQQLVVARKRGNIDSSKSSVGLVKRSRLTVLTAQSGENPNISQFSTQENCENKDSSKSSVSEGHKSPTILREKTPSDNKSNISPELKNGYGKSLEREYTSNPAKGIVPLTEEFSIVNINVDNLERIFVQKLPDDSKIYLVRKPRKRRDDSNSPETTEDDESIDLFVREFKDGSSLVYEKISRNKSGREPDPEVVEDPPNVPRKPEFCPERAVLIHHANGSTTIKKRKQCKTDDSDCEITLLPNVDPRGKRPRLPRFHVTPHGMILPTLRKVQHRKRKPLTMDELFDKAFPLLPKDIVPRKKPKLYDRPESSTKSTSVTKSGRSRLVSHSPLPRLRMYKPNRYGWLKAPSGPVKCVFCKSKATDAIFAHGTTAHCAACADCASKYRRSGGRNCPTCKGRFSSQTKYYNVNF